MSCLRTEKQLIIVTLLLMSSGVFAFDLVNTSLNYDDPANAKLYSEQIRAIEELGKQKDIEGLIEFSENVTLFWPDRNLAVYGRLINEVRRQFGNSSERIKRADIALGISRSALTVFDGKFLEQIAPEALEEYYRLQAGYLWLNYGAPSESYSKSGWPVIRREIASRKLNIWMMIQAAKDEAYDPEAPPRIPIGLSLGYPGMDPNAIADPGLRAQYIASLEEHRAKSKWFNVQHELRQLEKLVRIDLERMTIEDFYARDDAAAMEELRSLLDAYVFDEKVEDRLLRAAHPRRGAHLDPDSPLWNPERYDGALFVSENGPDRLPTVGEISPWGEPLWVKRWSVRHADGSPATDAIETTVTSTHGNVMEAIQVVTTQRIEIQLANRVALPDATAGQAYRVSMWVNVEPPDAGVGAFELRGFDAAGQPVRLLEQGGSPAADASTRTSDPTVGIDMYWARTLAEMDPIGRTAAQAVRDKAQPTPGNWFYWVHYLIPAAEQHAWAEPRGASGRNFQAPANLATVTPNFTFEPREGRTVTIRLAQPRLQSVELEPDPPRRAP